MKCEFEEKTYENYHNIELMGKSRIFYPPGQVQEHVFGFDSALFSQNREFWKLWRRIPWWKMPLWAFFPDVPTGVYLNDIFWEDLREFIDEEIGYRFKFNVFVQYKRPEYVKSTKAREYSYWGRPYYRYGINDHQQEVLVNIERQVNDQAIVVYAAPAFCTLNELFDYFDRRKIIENSNYVRPSTVDGHSKWTYINSGTVGWAFSKPRRKESVKLMEYINLVKRNTRESEIESNSQFINKTSTILVESIRSTEYLSKVFDRIMEQIVLPDHPLGRAIIMIYLSLDLARLRWGIYYERK